MEIFFNFKGDLEQRQLLAELPFATLNKRNANKATKNEKSSEDCPSLEQAQKLFTSRWRQAFLNITMLHAGRVRTNSLCVLECVLAGSLWINKKNYAREFHGRAGGESKESECDACFRNKKHKAYLPPSQFSRKLFSLLFLGNCEKLFSRIEFHLAQKKNNVEMKLSKQLKNALLVH